MEQDHETQRSRYLSKAIAKLRAAGLAYALVPGQAEIGKRHGYVTVQIIVTAEEAGLTPDLFEGLPAAAVVDKHALPSDERLYFTDVQEGGGFELEAWQKFKAGLSDFQFQWMKDTALREQKSLSAVAIEIGLPQ